MAFIRLLKDKIGRYKKMSYYNKRKEELRQEAIQWEYDFPERKMSYYELMCEQYYFYKYGKRYGLIREFKENGII
jgi:hypothetical protein